MSPAEHEFYDILVKTVGDKYYVFAQVHLSTFLDHKINGRNNFGAFRHIDEKSVDFVLCDKAYISPKLAIELDDKTHDRADRQSRDLIVEEVLREAGMPLLRIKNQGKFDPLDLASQIDSALMSQKD